jgi:hypothetical protein
MQESALNSQADACLTAWYGHRRPALLKQTMEMVQDGDLVDPVPSGANHIVLLFAVGADEIC